MRSVMKEQREVGALLGLDCGDNSCYFTAQSGGMRTNGGCRCELVARIREDREARAELDAAVEELCEHLDLSGEIRKARMLGKRVRELMKKAGK